MISNPFRPELIPEYILKLLQAMGVTARIALSSLALGLLIAFGIAALSLARQPFLKVMGSAYIGFVRGVPPLVLILLLYLGFPQLMKGIGVDMSGVSKESYMVVIFALIVSAGFSEIMRSSFLAIDKGQREAALSSGMTGIQAFRRIVLPQAFAVALPSIGNIVIMLFKLTSLAFTIGIIDIMGKARLLVTSLYSTRKLEVYIALAIVYWVICAVLEQVNKLLVKRFSRGHKQTKI